MKTDWPMFAVNAACAVIWGLIMCACYGWSGEMFSRHTIAFMVGVAFMRSHMAPRITARVVVEDRQGRAETTDL